MVISVGSGFSATGYTIVASEGAAAELWHRCIEQVHYSSLRASGSSCLLLQHVLCKGTCSARCRSISRPNCPGTQASCAVIAVVIGLGKSTSSLVYL